MQLGFVKLLEPLKNEICPCWTVFDWHCWRFSVEVVGVPDNRLAALNVRCLKQVRSYPEADKWFFCAKKKCEVVPRICVKDVVSHESWVRIMLRAQIFQSRQRPHPQKLRQFDSQENDFESSNWKVEFFLLLALRSCQIIWYFLRYQQWVLPTAAFHCFALHGPHGGSLMSSYCLKFESSCRAAEMKSFGKESKLYHVVGLCHIVSQSPSRLELLFLVLSPRFAKCDGHVFYTDTGSPGAEELHLQNRQAKWSMPHWGVPLEHRSRTSFGWVCQLKRWAETKVVGSITGAKSASDPQHHTI